MSEVLYNRGAFLIVSGTPTLTGATSIRAILAVSATSGGAALGAGWDNKDLNTVAELDALTDVTLLTADRVSLTTGTITEDDTNDRVNLDTDNFSFDPVAGQSARAIFLYDATVDTDDTTRLLICGSNTNFPQPLDGGLTVQVADWMRARQGA